MRRMTRSLTILLFSVSIVLRISPAQTSSSADLFKTGRVELVLEKRVTDKDMPAGSQFQNPRGLAVDAKGNVYVVDAGTNDLKVFSADGTFVRTVGSQGNGPGEFSGPEFIEIAGDKIFVWEAMNRRISLLGLDGKFVRSVPYHPGIFGVFVRMRALSDGRLVLFVERGLAQESSSSVPTTQDFAIEVLSADLSQRRTIWQKKIRASRLVSRPEYGTSVRVPFPYHPGVRGDVVQGGTVAVGYTEKYEVELLDPDRGRLSTFSHPFKPVKLEERDKKAHFDRFRMAVFKDGIKTIMPKPPEFILQNTEFPEYLPPYRDLFFDASGNIWTHVYADSRASNVFDVFSPQGDFIRQITLEGVPIEHTFSALMGIRFAAGGLWKIEYDDEGYASLARYRLVPGAY